MTADKEIRVLLVDDHQVIRDLVASMLRAEDGSLKVVTTNGKESALALLSKDDPFDVVLLDYSMPDMNGISGIEEVITTGKGAAVVLFTGLESKSIITNAMQIGVRCVIPKNSPANMIPKIIDLVLSGATYLPAEIFSETEDDTKIHLTPRETEVLLCLREGMLNREISEKLGISGATVKLHLRTLCGKLGAKNRTQAVMIAEEMQL